MESEDSQIFNWGHNENTDELPEYFLEYYRKGNYKLASSDPNIEGSFRRFDCGNLEKATEYVRKYNGKLNLYYHVNNPINGGFKESSFNYLEHLIFDIDAGESHRTTPATEKEIEELQKKLPVLKQELEKDGLKYDFLHFTGNGFQPVFSVKPVEKKKYNFGAIKSYVKDLEKRTGLCFDSTFDLPRVARIPGTINPKGGRRSTILDGSIFNKYQNDITQILEKYNDLSTLSNVQKHTLDKTPRKTLEKDKHTPRDLSYKRLEKIKKKDEKLKDLHSGNWKKYEYQSRSEAEFGLIQKLIRYGFDKSFIFNIMDSCKIGKWQERKDAYREHQYKRSEEMYRASNSIMTKKGEIFEFDPNNDRCRIINLRDFECVQAVHDFSLLLATKIKNKKSSFLIKMVDCNLDTLDLVTNPTIRKQLDTRHFDNDIFIIVVKVNDFYDWNKKKKEFVPSQKKTTEFLLNTEYFLTFADTDELYWYDDGVYRESGDVFVKTYCNLIFPDLLPSFLEDLIKRIKSRTYIEREYKNDRYICLQNGIYDIEDKKFMEHTPDILFFNKINAFFNLDTNLDTLCSNFQKFLSEVANEEDVPAILEMFGYCLLREYKYHNFFILKGDGRNGKTVLLSVLQAFLGKGNFSSVPLQTLSKDQFAAADLYDKLANISDDIPASDIKNTGLIKMLTGSSPIRARKIYKGSFIYYNQAKLIFSCNKLPRVEDETSAFFSRYVSFNFVHKFDGRICPSCGKIHNCDPNLLVKLTTKEELSSIFNLALEGLFRLLKQGYFSATKSDDENKKQWQRDTDPFVAFKDDFLTSNSLEFIFKKEGFSVFCKYCKEHNLPYISYTTFCQRIHQHFKVEDTKRMNYEGKRESCFVGISWKKKEENNET